MKKMISSFEDLDVWQKSRELRKNISKLIRAFPESEKFRLVDQIVRSSRSITSNIAEGYGRFHYQENIQFCRQARGSLYELLDHLNISLDEKYIKESKYKKFREQIFDIIRMLNGYIRYLKNKKDKDNSTSKSF